MAYDDLKRLAGVHVGATPLKPASSTLFKLKAPIAPVTPAAPAASHSTAPVQRPAPAAAPAPAALKMGASANTKITPPAPAPMPNVAPPPPPAASTLHFSTQPIAPSSLAAIAKAAGVALPPAATAPAATKAATMGSMLATHSAATAPSPATQLRAGVTASSKSGGTTGLVQRAPAAPDTNTFHGGADSGASGFSRVERSARPVGTTAPKGQKTMGQYKGTGEKTYLPINSVGVVNAGAQVTLPGVRPSKPFQGQGLLIDPSLAQFAIVDIKLGNEPVAVTAGAVSAGCFPAQNGPRFEWKVADGVDVIFTVSNGGTVSVAFSAMVIGEICEAA